MPVPQQVMSVRFRSPLPGGYWVCNGKPGNGAGMKVDPAAGGWDENLEMSLSQQQSDHLRHRGAALPHSGNKEEKRTAYSL